MSIRAADESLDAYDYFLRGMASFHLHNESSLLKVMSSRARDGTRPQLRLSLRNGVVVRRAQEQPWLDG